MFNKDPDVVAEQAPLITLDIKSSICMSKNCKYTKNTRQISRRINFVRNVEECNLQTTVCCEGGLRLADIGTNNVRGNELNSRLGYAMVILEYWQKTCERGITGYRRLWRKIWYEWIDWIGLRTQLNEFEILILV